MLIRTGDRVMPSLAVTAARLAAKYHVGSFGDDLFANVVADPAKNFRLIMKDGRIYKNTLAA